MRIPKRLELHAAAGADTPEMQYDLIQIHGRRAYATDGIVVASVPLNLEPGEDLPDGTLVAPRAWSYAVNGSRGDGLLRLEAGGQVCQPREEGPLVTVRPPTRGEGELPPVREVLDELRPLEQGGDVVEVLLDAEALHRLARALGAVEGVRLRFEVDATGQCRSCVAVTPAAPSSATGLIMPIVLEGHDE